jgi:uncharacterized protein (DUF2164 family)
MKKITLMAALLVVIQLVKAEKISEYSLPNEVKTIFAKMFPNQYSVKWELENGNYEAEFMLNKVETSALYSPTGQWLQTETEIKVDVLPMAVIEYVSKNLAGKKIKEASKIIDAKGNLFYEVEVNGNDYIFDTKGNYLRTEKA